MLLGAGATAAAGEQAFDALSGWRGPASPSWPATMDNELRFYAALWGGYGVLLVLAARDFAARAGQVPWLAAALFARGAGPPRPAVPVGPPAPLLPASL